MTNRDYNDMIKVLVTLANALDDIQYAMEFTHDRIHDNVKPTRDQCDIIRKYAAHLMEYTDYVRTLYDSDGYGYGVSD